MSHCLILQQYNEFYIGADTAGSMLIDGKFHRVSNDMKKIFLCGSDIYFCSGINRNVDICNKWILDNNQDYINIANLQKFLINNFSNKSSFNCFDIELLICRIDDGVSKVYHLAQYNNFDIVTYEGRKNQINIICGGCKTKDGFNYAKELIYYGDVKTIYNSLFNKISDERIGGKLLVYHNNQIYYDSKIDDFEVNTHMILSDACIAGYIQGATIEGGTLKIGKEGGPYFKVNEDGSVEITDADGSSKYASSSDMTILQDARRFHTEIQYSGLTVFSDPNSSCTLTAKVYSWDKDITDELPTSTKFSWIRSSNGDDSTWNTNHANRSSNTITITNSDVEGNAQFSCKITFDDDNL